MLTSGLEVGTRFLQCVKNASLYRRKNSSTTNEYSEYEYEYELIFIDSLFGAVKP